MLVADKWMYHSIELRKLGGRRIEDEESRGLKQDMLAKGSTLWQSIKIGIGLTEETNKKIQEALQSCHWIEKRKASDDTLRKMEMSRQENVAMLQK